MIPSFLDGFNHLTEDDLEIMAEYEEEQRRKGHFELIFPTKETIEKDFENNFKLLIYIILSIMQVAPDCD